jgi:Spy/CpxP family protein refolding chaperone
MRRLIAALTVAIAVPVLALAQTGATTNMDILRQKIKADKKLVVAENLQLTDAEGAKFWPVYDAYQKELQQINERLTAVILAYAEAYKKGAVPDATAKKLIEDAAAVDDAEATLKRTSLPKILAVLPAAKAARYVQIENKIRAVIRYELAAGIPLVQ